MTSLLSEKEIGQNYLLLTIVSLFTFTFLGPYNQFFSRKTVQWKGGGDLKNAMVGMLFYRSFVAILSTAVALFIYSNYGEYYSNVDFALFIFISSIGTFSLLLLSTVNLLGNPILFIKLQVLLSLCALTLSFIFVVFINRSGMAWLYGVAITETLFIVPLFFVVTKGTRLDIKKIYHAINFESIKRLLIFTAPITLTLFLQWGQNSSYRFIVEERYSIELLGVIGVGLVVSTAIFSAVDSVACQFFNPIYFRSISNADKNTREDAWNKYAINMLSIYIVTLLYVVTTAPFLLKLLVDEKFHHVYNFVMVGALIEFCRVCCNVIYMISQSEIDTKKTVAPYILGYICLLSVLIFVDMAETPILIPITQAISYIVIIIFLYREMSFLLNVSLNYYYLLKVFLASSALSLCLMIPYDLSFFSSFAIVFVAGLYFVFLIYIFVYKSNQRELV
tara:strand:- start:9014 stop:10357 length:1344 start_codon:yes stop_codon:yes gene_type:complete